MITRHLCPLLIGMAAGALLENLGERRRRRGRAGLITGFRWIP